MTDCLDAYLVGARCECYLCRRHRRLYYVQNVLRRAGDEPSADWLGVMFDHLLDVEEELEMAEHG